MTVCVWFTHPPNACLTPRVFRLPGGARRTLTGSRAVVSALLACVCAATASDPLLTRAVRSEPG